VAIDPEELVTLTDHGTMKLRSAVVRAMILSAKERKRATIVREGKPAILHFKQIRGLGAKWDERRGSSPRRKDLAMVRLLSILTFGSLLLFSNPASADPTRSREGMASEISSRQRCVCSTWHQRPTRVVRHSRHYRIRTAYLIGYDPLPYRFGSTFVLERPYRYYWD